MGELCYYCNACTISDELNAIGGAYSCCAFEMYDGQADCGASNVILQRYA